MDDARGVRIALAKLLRLYWSGKVKADKVRVITNGANVLLRAIELEREHAKSAPTNGDLAVLARGFAAMVYAAGTGSAAPGNNSVPNRTQTVQDGTRGPEIIQDGDSQADAGLGGNEP